MRQKKDKIKAAAACVREKIAAHARLDRVAAGLSAEGWDGGYYAALQDVLLLLNDVIPDRCFWNGRSE